MKNINLAVLALLVGYAITLGTGYALARAPKFEAVAAVDGGATTDSEGAPKGRW